MLASRFGVLIRNSKWNQHVRLFQPQRALPPDEPEFLAQLKQTGQPLVLTINGKAELVVQDAASYQKLLALAERLEAMQAVKEGLASASRGEGRPMDDVFDGMEKELRADAAR